MTGVAPTIAEGPAAASGLAPRLRLLPKGAGANRPPASVAGAEDGPADGPLLVAGRDPLRRAEVLHDLSETMPAGTRFEELGELWEVLAWAPASRAVIISGEL